MLTTSFINKRNNFEIREIWDYLQKYGVEFDNPEATVVVRENGKIIGTGSVHGKVMKYMFIDDNYKGLGILPKIYNSLLTYLLDKNILEHFIFTKPENEMIFTGIGLKKVLSTERVLLLEGGFGSYSSWINSIKSQLNKNIKNRGAIVANCNPMTKGHKYLMEYARDRVDELIVFIVEEDQSDFPTDVRYEIVKNEFKDDYKVVVVLGGPYIISQATFPTYFIKRLDETTEIYTELDANIFAQKIAVDLDISVRFVGDEPIDRLTAEYNNKLLKSTENMKMRLEKIDRIKDNEEYISASKVRRFIKEGNLDKAFSMLTNSSIDFLKTDEGQKIIEKIQRKES